MLNSKQRAYLMKMASNEPAIFQIGKSSLTPEIIAAVDSALEKRELIKISVLKNCADDPRELAEMMAERTHARVVQVIGKKIVLFRVSKKKPVIELPR
ncbi:MAG: ribosome assembly RNA-binding protein YhbY [Lachnospiraceae bacterium]|nr:ribosome assembly RNA-binding protein YhbY [Lachnospiraceae bacterium]